MYHLRLLVSYFAAVRVSGWSGILFSGFTQEKDRAEDATPTGAEATALGERPQ